MNCNQCNSPDVISNLRVLDRDGEGDVGDLALETHLAPHSLFLTEAVSVPLVANVCTSCGHVMFSVDQGGLDTIRQAAAALQAVKSTEQDLDSSPGFGSFIGDDVSEEK